MGKDPNKIDEVIKALETVPCSAHTLLPKEKAVLGSTEKGRFHSYPGCIPPHFQFQGKDKIVLVGYGVQNPYFRAQYPEDFLKQYFGTPSPPKKPSELRKALGLS